jgi:prepilin-type N-terminal cleavage/methylation domain-containing protein
LRSPPKSLSQPRPKPRPRGFTLLELVVVLVVLALAAALAAPALSRDTGHGESALGSLILGAREAAARRGETIHLTVSSSGSWAMQGAGSASDGPIRSGEVEPFPGAPLTLIVSPLGSCGFDAPSMQAASVIRLDFLSCTPLD